MHLQRISGLRSLQQLGVLYIKAYSLDIIPAPFMPGRLHPTRLQFSPQKSSANSG